MDGRDFLFYDGDCGLCHRAVMFTVHRDRKASFLFAPLDGETFRRMNPHSAGPLPDSLAVLHEERLFLRSDAVLHVLRVLGGGWGLLGAFLGICPRSVRDALYDVVARHRSRFFARPETPCPWAGSELARRFLP